MISKLASFNENQNKQTLEQSGNEDTFFKVIFILKKDDPILNSVLTLVYPQS